MSIEQAMVGWKGKSAEDITAIHDRYCQSEFFIADLIRLSSQRSCEKAATWLVKHHLEKRHRLEPGEIAQLYEVAQHFENWEAKLHILQCIQYMPIAESEKDRVEHFLRKCLMDTNKLVRAWAYNGFYETALQFPEYRDEAQKLLAMAMQDEAASVKARIKNVLKRQS